VSIVTTVVGSYSLRPSKLVRLRQQAQRLAVPVALVLLLAGALALRVRGLPAADGILGIDQARLTLVAQGITAHGWPVFPTGKVYTRGLVQSLLMAASLSLFEPLDVAARLPSVLAGVALVYVMFAYGRQLAGPGAGLMAAALTATSLPLIATSREAWLYSIFVLFWMLSLSLLDRAVFSGSRRTLLLGLAVAGLSCLAHEFALALLPAIGVALFFLIRTAPDKSARRWPLLAAALLVGLGLSVMAGFSLTLRSDTVGGTLSEIRGFLAFHSDLDRIAYYFSRLVPGRGLWLLGPVALAAIWLAGRPLRRRLLLPLLGAGTLFVLISFLLAQRQERYGLALVPMLLLFTAVGLTVLAERLRGWLPARWTTTVVASLALLVIVGQTDLARLAPPQTRNRIEASWVTRLHRIGYKPGDLVLPNTPPGPHLYLGRTDYWLRSSRFEKYVRQQGDRLRDIHTDAILVRNVNELEEALRPSTPGRRAWVIVWKTPLGGRGLETDIRNEVQRQARGPVQADDWLIYELRLR
jgi:4-amino-4-deoxy-L-arabinose transferase-like glycosyltransferase